MDNTFKAAKNGNIIAWNDKFPDGTNKNGNAHSKGVIFYDPKKD